MNVMDIAKRCISRMSQSLLVALWCESEKANDENFERRILREKIARGKPRLNFTYA